MLESRVMLLMRESNKTKQGPSPSLEGWEGGWGKEMEGGHIKVMCCIKEWLDGTVTVPALTNSGRFVLPSSGSAFHS